MMVVENKYEIKDRVYLVTDAEQSIRIVCAITIYASGVLLYRLACGADTSEHYDFEISSEKELQIK